jgi:membrane protein YqaA with SNARE-associated domain
MVEGNVKAKRLRFLMKNLLKGFLYLGILVILFYLIRQQFSEQERLQWFGTIYNNPYLVIVVYVGSEIFFGIIPPEIFMLWSWETGWIGPYFSSVGLLSVISYSAGYLNFNFGLIINHRIHSLKSKNRFIQKYMDLFSQYGAFLVVVASTTPLPFSLIALLGGAAGLEKRKYIVYSLLRILRFFVYAYVLWLIQH